MWAHLAQLFVKVEMDGGVGRGGWCDGVGMEGMCMSTKSVMMGMAGEGL